MDTREKIVAAATVGSLLRQGAWIAVAGLFDPLTALQANRIASFRREGKRVIAIVERGEDTLMTPEARAALIAALRTVDAVTIADRASSIVPPNSKIDLIQDAAGETARSRQFIEFVLERQRIPDNQ